MEGAWAERLLCVWSRGLGLVAPGVGSWQPLLAEGMEQFMPCPTLPIHKVKRRAIFYCQLKVWLLENNVGTHRKTMQSIFVRSFALDAHWFNRLSTLNFCVCFLSMKLDFIYLYKLQLCNITVSSHFLYAGFKSESLCSFAALSHY